MSSGRQHLTEEDRAEWARYARHVRPLPGRLLPAQSPVSSRSEGAVAPTQLPSKPRPIRPGWPPVTVGSQPAGVDNATWQRFRTGKLAPARTLDLHGRTAQRSFHALVHFLAMARADGLRCVEIVTGRGSGEAGGVLRRELPLWLNLPELRPLILAAAHPHAGNPGAVRVLLRRVP
jgi:DNA-nicking Smr family endonuclease